MRGWFGSRSWGFGRSLGRDFWFVRGWLGSRCRLGGSFWCWRSRGFGRRFFGNSNFFGDVSFGIEAKITIWI